MATTNSSPSSPCKGAYIILPPGHGKSVLHSPSAGLYEADQLVAWRGTDALSKYRDEAKVSGDWALYDREWGKLLREALPKGGLLMVPARQVGEAAGLVYWGAGRLPLERWGKNFENRKGDPDKYMECWTALEGSCDSLTSNYHTTYWVQQKLTDWTLQQVGQELEGAD